MLRNTATNRRRHSAVTARSWCGPRLRPVGAPCEWGDGTGPRCPKLARKPTSRKRGKTIGYPNSKASNTRLGQRRKAQTTRMESSGDMGVPGCKREIDCEEAGALSGIALIRRLPQLDLVAIQIVNPRESAVVVVLPLRIDTHALPAQRHEQLVQPLDDVVDHERLIHITRRGRKDAPHRHLLARGVGFR